MDNTFEFAVESLFHMKGRGTVFAGTIRKGKIFVGDTVEVHSPQNHLKVTVTGIEQIKTHELLKSAGQGDEIGISASGFDPERLVDGIETIEIDGFKTLKPRQLTIEKSAKSWWKSLFTP